jgi:hypothetical protein
MNYFIRYNMTITDRLVDKGWFRVLKVISLLLVGIALLAEILPEVEAKLIVVPALIVVLMIGIVEVRRR